MKEKKVSIDAELQRRLANLDNGRDEMNLCELPFATLSERADQRTMLKYEVRDYDHRLKQVVQRSLTVKGDEEFGLPTAKDEELYLGLLKFTNDYNGFSHPEVHFTRADLLDLLGWRKSRWSYDRLTLGMQRLVGVRLSYQNLWRDNRDKQWRDQGAFGILESFRFRDSRKANESFTERQSMFRWSAVLFDSFDSGYLKRIDYGLARSLSVKARRLYRYLDKHFHPPRKMTVELDLATLAYQHIGISSGIELDKVRKRYIAPAAEELQQAGYLQAVPSDQIFERVSRGHWNAKFHLADVTAAKARSESPASIAPLLCRRGLSETVASQLSHEHPVAALKQAVKAMDEQLRKGTSIRSPDRWFTAAVKNGYQPTDHEAMSSNRPERRIFRKGRFIS